MRIEMTFGRLTNKRRILRRTLDFSIENNAKLVRVCTKLHNFCIRMAQLDGGGRVGRLDHANFNRTEYGIEALEDTEGKFGCWQTHPDDGSIVPPPLDNYSSLLPDPSRRDKIYREVVTRKLERPGLATTWSATKNTMQLFMIN